MTAAGTRVDGQASIDVLDVAPVGPPKLERRLRDERRLRHAVAHGEFEVHYQAVVELSTARVVGAEALLRWVAPDGRGIPPEEFIALAEEIGVIDELGEWVFRQVCEGSPRDPNGNVLPVSVNVSAVQLADPNLSERFAAVLRDSHADPRSITLEITETALMKDPKAALESLTRLRALGMMVSVDDFGTGYSSLTYLKQFPIDIVKIDRSFVGGLGSNPDDEMIVAAIVNLAHTLGLHVIAEGVENSLQSEMLYRLGCRFGQGYLWGRAEPSQELSKRLAGPGTPAQNPLNGAELASGWRESREVSPAPAPVSERDIKESFWRKQIDIGLLLWLAGVTCTFGYLHATAGQPHRIALAQMTLAGVAASLGVFWLGGRRALSTRWQTPFFLAWSLGTMLMMTAAAALDGGARSPLVWLITLPVIFAGLTYPPGAVAILAVAGDALYVTVALGSHGSAPSLTVIGMTFSIGGILMIVGASNRRTQERQLTALATHDGLTGCLTHRALKDRLAREMLIARRDQDSLSLLIAEVDRLALINDVGGHGSGDTVLATVGRALAASARPDRVGRIGGDEFAVIVTGVGEEGLAELLGRAHAQLEQQLPDWIGVTLGAASLRDLETPGDLMKRADRALYAAKQRRVGALKR